MNAEHQALAEYLERRLQKVPEVNFGRIRTQLERSEGRLGEHDNNFASIETHFNRIHGQLKSAETELQWIHTRVNNLIEHVDRKNDKQDELLDEQLEDHEQRITTLESHYATD